MARGAPLRGCAVLAQLHIHILANSPVEVHSRRHKFQYICAAFIINSTFRAHCVCDFYGHLERQSDKFYGQNKNRDGRPDQTISEIVKVSCKFRHRVVAEISMSIVGLTKGYRFHEYYGIVDDNVVDPDPNISAVAASGPFDFFNVRFDNSLLTDQAPIIRPQRPYDRQIHRIPDSSIGKADWFLKQKIQYSSLFDFEGVNGWFDLLSTEKRHHKHG